MSNLHWYIRMWVAYPVGLVCRLTGFRFSKEYRWGVTRWHRMVYACVWTVKANWIADRS